ncbi:MAG TPA: D-glycerate dehydrogenase [Brumimicrobium sp.]|nr:D-glycerate dehydrogenase [Brumimicrobium sp.]
MAKVFCTRRIGKVGLDLIKEEGHTVSIWEREEVPTPEELIQLCKEHDALIVADRNKIDENFLRSSSHLKVIALHSIGHNQVDMKAAKALRIPVGNTPKGGFEATADTAFMLMITASKKAFYMHQKIRKGEWGGFAPTQNLGISLRNKVLGVFGLGTIGYEMARLSKAAYAMDIIYHNRNRNEKAEKELGAKYVSFDDLLKQSDVLSVHASLTKETYGRFDAEAFKKMKSSAIFVNTSRGLMHDENALKEALLTGEIWGAGLDVTNPEPMSPENELLDLPTVAITPHIGSAVDKDRDEMARMVAKNIIAGLNGEKLPHEVS